MKRDKTQIGVYVSAEKKEIFKAALRARGWQSLKSFVLAVGADPEVVQSYVDWCLKNGVPIPQAPPKTMPPAKGTPKNLMNWLREHKGIKKEDKKS